MIAVPAYLSVVEGQINVESAGLYNHTLQPIVASSLHPTSAAQVVTVTLRGTRSACQMFAAEVLTDEIVSVELLGHPVVSRCHDYRAEQLPFEPLTDLTLSGPRVLEGGVVGSATPFSSAPPTPAYLASALPSVLCKRRRFNL